MVRTNKYFINLNDIIIYNKENYCENYLPNQTKITHLNYLKNEGNIINIWNDEGEIFRDLITHKLSLWNVNYDILFMKRPEYCKYTAMIIEPRCHPALELVLKNFNKNLSDDWQFLIFHGNNNLDYINNIINQNEFNDRQIKLKHVKVNNLSINEYNLFMFNEYTYTYIDTEVFLIFQTDTLLSDLYSKNINYYVNYDYVGAPWVNSHNCNIENKCGNGGLSLRRKSKMLEILSYGGFLKNKNKMIAFNEDLFFSNVIYENNIILNKPSFEDSQLFSVESSFHDKSIGIHKPWKSFYWSEYHLNIIKNHIPNINELIRFNN
jgi:hypothetical protein